VRSMVTKWMCVYVCVCMRVCAAWSQSGCVCMYVCVCACMCVQHGHKVEHSEVARLFAAV